MRFPCYLAIGVLGCAAFGVILNCGASSQAQTVAAAPAMTAPPPQQMPVYGLPEVSPYPSTSAPEVAPALLANNNIPAGGTAPAAALGVPNNLDGGDAVTLYAPYGSPDAMTSARANEANAAYERSLIGSENWSWQLLPTGLMYKTYLAGQREPRLGSQFVHERNQGWLWDAAIGARVGIWRYGTNDPLWPQGWQLDVEAAAFPRLDLRSNRDMIATDFRAGMPLTTRQGPWEAKFGYDHYCSHLGDEYVLTHEGVARTNYVRETLLLGLAVYLNPSLRLYSEAAWAFYVDGGAKPWEFQFGVDFSSPEPSGVSGDPFFAINARLRQENDFGGNMTVQTGWQWRGRTGQLFRFGMQYFNGMSDQRQFNNVFEEQIGFGLWYDF